MTLSVDIKGEGPALVLLHGWGMHSAVWLDIVPLLTQHFRLYLVDLPGHGDSDFGARASLTDWARAVLEVTPQRAGWIGWSLGGLVALRAAQLQAQRINKLILLCSTPRFIRSTDWPHAVAGEVLEDFAHQFEADFSSTLKRFLALQVSGSRQSTQTLRVLHNRILEKKAPDVSALQAGLAILESADFRVAMNNFPVPLACLLASRDTLVPVQLAEHYPLIPRQIIQGAGHAPFVSHPQQCAESIKYLLDATACFEEKLL